MVASAFKDWVIRPADPANQRALAQGLGLHPITAAVLVARGLLSEDAAKRALSSDAEAVPDPFLLPGMEQAVDRLHRAVRAGEQILVYGDYDVDGVSATAVYLEFLKALGHRAAFYIPHRLKEGYGVNADAVRRIAASGVSLLITVDCGTTALRELALAKSLGLDVIVTDHHLVGEVLPPAVAVVNPCRADSDYPFQGLCSAGLAYKVATAYAHKYGPASAPLEDLLDLVTLATIADMVPLHGEHRAMIRHGLGSISVGRRPGLRALKEVAKLEGTCGVGTVSFTLAPRINAAGRLGDAADAVRLLLTDHKEEAVALAQVLDHLNRERQEIEERIMTEAVAAVEAAGGDRNSPIVLASRDWHPGVVGIVAGRLAERYYRPAVLIAINEDGTGRGSARTVSGVNIYEGIAQCRHHLDGFGGHAAAAGLTIREEAVPSFRDSLREALVAPLARISGRQLVCDAEAEPVALFPAMVRELEKLGPFGIGNPEPTLVFRNLRISSARVVGNNHMKLMVRGTRGAAVTAFGYGMGAGLDYSPNESVDLACSLDVNAWNGTEGVQLRIKDLRRHA